MRLRELDQEVIKFQPQSIICFPDGLADVVEDVGEGQVARDINGDLSKILMFGCDGSKCRGDPVDHLWLRLKNHISEFYRFREIDRIWPRLVLEQK